MPKLPNDTARHYCLGRKLKMPELHLQHADLYIGQIISSDDPKSRLAAAEALHKLYKVAEARTRVQLNWAGYRQEVPRAARGSLTPYEQKFLRQDEVATINEYVRTLGLHLTGPNEVGDTQRSIRKIFRKVQLRALTKRPI